MNAIHAHDRNPAEQARGCRPRRTPHTRFVDLAQGLRRGRAEISSGLRRVTGRTRLCWVRLRTYGLARVADYVSIIRMCSAALPPTVAGRSAAVRSLFRRLVTVSGLSPSDSRFRNLLKRKGKRKRCGFGHSPFDPQTGTERGQGGHRVRVRIRVRVTPPNTPPRTDVPSKSPSTAPRPRLAPECGPVPLSGDTQPRAKTECPTGLVELRTPIPWLRVLGNAPPDRGRLRTADPAPHAQSLRASNRMSL